MSRAFVLVNPSASFSSFCCCVLFSSELIVIPSNYYWSHLYSREGKMQQTDQPHDDRHPALPTDTPLLQRFNIAYRNRQEYSVPVVYLSRLNNFLRGSKYQWCASSPSLSLMRFVAYGVCRLLVVGPVANFYLKNVT